MNRKKILLIDDEQDILEIISYNLEKEGYQVFTAGNGNEGIEKAKEILPDLILLDVMMPEKDGIETCQDLRKIKELQRTLIVFLSARSEEFSQLAGYQAGANDYIVKLIKPKVLVSKVAALLQMGANSQENSNYIELGDLIIDKDNFKVSKGKEEFLLPKKEFDLLYLLASNTEKVFKREEILEKVWGNDVIVGERTIDVHIRRLREKLGINTIQTLKGIGYKLVV
ncbi:MULTISPECIES: response regulator transcription factor [Epilithonimonas]|jgi:two-component system, OmpR family, alkaline phosphatase synthesis response regulator PhoP|uniref:Phosphate regulon transcriptional regulatory protein PhoB n=1 Tax=Epilithonimonas hungarica TaxID=454006 RepID=A0A1G7JKC3_9FLAO|nr:MULTISPECIES: response regulator transcription factor [Epilithonimonas]MDP9956115.1 two-component system alkaline phosphatase synthesis response regulator PhoP [Epilithonimonas hungarica]MPS72699.1 response regulator transcription factor [Chryseobacterium sp.]MPT30074.1 response regulator transcription factor [Chryseobacterium sp.]SDF25412.1 two-component system, OmpR family, alkaline phosphatase synthesis response regulator PhoP [Epilithonimonas hungarica]